MTRARRAKLADKIAVAQAKAEKPENLLEHDRAVLRERAAGLSWKKRYEAARERLDVSEQRVELLTRLGDRKNVGPIRRSSKRSSRDAATGCLVYSDWHVEEPVEPEKVNGLNEYDLEIADQRIRGLWNKSAEQLEDARHRANVRTLVVGLLGDFISGDIHEELAESALLHPLDACLWVEERLETGLRTFAADPDIDEIIVVTSYGNHGRTKKKKRISHGAETSYEHNMYLHLAQRFRDEKKIRFQFGVGYHNWLRIYDFDFRFHHGDDIEYKGGVGGATIPINKAVAAWNKAQRSYCDVFGHFHTFNWHAPRNTWLCNGSLIGYSPLSIAFKSDYEDPRQMFLVVDQHRGLVKVEQVYCQ